MAQGFFRLVLCMFDRTKQIAITSVADVRTKLDNSNGKENIREQNERKRKKIGAVSLFS